MGADQVTGPGRVRALSVWTIYDHPSDMPDKFVARRSEIAGGRVRQTDETLTSDDLYMLRRTFADAGLIRFHRAPSDDPVIVESWL